MYSFSAYEVNPRKDADIIGPPRIENVRYSPAPPVAGSQVTVSCTITASGTITSAKLYWKLHSSAIWSNVDLVDQGGNLWSAPLGPYATATEIDYYVLVSDNAGMDARRPSEGNYGFYVGTIDIDDIQYVVTPGVDDESPLLGHAVNVEGYVVAEPGVFGPYTFYIAEAAGPWHRGLRRIRKPHVQPGRLRHRERHGRRVLRPHTDRPPLPRDGAHDYPGGPT
jgi:hypothetical protein